MKAYELDDLELLENALYLRSEKTLVISDLQLGYEQQLRAHGHNIVYEQASKMRLLLSRLLEQTKATRLVINGDLKHEFGKISSQERRDIIGILSELQKRVEIVVVKGNHDTITKPLTDELGISFVNSFLVNEVLCVHGHVEPTIPKGVKTIIIGHMHPAVNISDGVRKERFKCFLLSTYKRKRLVILPSFSTIVEGTDVLAGALHTPLLTKKTLQSAKIYAIADEIRLFGTVSVLSRIAKGL